MSEPTVNQPAAEREPDHVTPASICSNGWHVSRQQPTRPCPTCGDVADYAADQLLDREREPDHVTPTPDVHLDAPGTWESENLPCGYPFNVVRYGETTSDPALVTCAGCRATLPKPADLDRRARAHADALAWLFGQTSVEPKSEVIHFDGGRPDQHAACGYDLDRNGPDGWTADRAKVTCSDCAGKLVDEQLVEPERRTVSLEVLTDELFEQEAERRHAEAKESGCRPERLPTDAKVAVVLRTNGELVAIEDTDSNWRRFREMPTYVLARLLEQVGNCAVGGLEGVPEVKALMPTPDVLAALDGRPDAQLLTAPVWVLAMDIEQGMLLAPLDDPWQQLVTAPPGQCTKPGCDEGASCVVLVVDTGELHQSGYARTRVRIPVAVTL